jgi:hypothetical protein
MTGPSDDLTRRHGRHHNLGGNSGSYEQMQNVLRSQEAVNEQVRQAMAAFQLAADLFVEGQNTPGYHGSPTGSSGGRPTMNSNQNYLGMYSNQGMAGGPSGRGIAGIRRMAASSLHSAVGTAPGSRYDRVMDDHTGQQVGWKETTASGAVIHRPLHALSDNQVARANALNSVAQGAGIGTALRAMPRLGYIGLGLEAAHEAVTFIGNQRAANAQYQSIYGGSNFSQFGQRGSQFGFQLGQLFGGGMTWGQSQEAFHDVASLGYQGSQRSDMLSFMTRNYMSMGVSVSDSFKLIQTAASNLNESLSGLHEGLQNTRNAAIATGQSGNVGTQIFQQNYASLSRSYAGPGVAAIASSLSTMQAGMGRYLSGVDLTQQLNDPRQVTIMANRLGMNQTQFTAAVQRGDPRVLQAMTWNLQRVTAPVINNPDMNRVLNRVMSGPLTDRLVSTLAKGGDPSQILERVAQSMMNSGINYGPALQAQMASIGYANMPLEQASEIAILRHIHARPQLPQTTAHMGNADALPPLSHTSGNLPGKFAVPRVAPVDASRQGVNPIIDHLKDAIGDKGYGIVVHDGKTGGQRVVNLDTAIKYYPDQLALGTARIRDLNNESVHSFLGSSEKKFYYTKDYQRRFEGRNVENTIDAPSYTGGGPSSDKTGGTSQDDLGSSRGMSVAAYDTMKQKQAIADVKHSAGTVTIVPSRELYNLLNFVPSGNVNVATQAAAANSTVIPGQ